MHVEMKDGRRGRVDDDLSNAASKDQGKFVTVVKFEDRTEQISFADVVTTFSGVSTPMTGRDASRVY